MHLYWKSLRMNLHFWVLTGNLFPNIVCHEAFSSHYHHQYASRVADSVDGYTSLLQRSVHLASRRKEISEGSFPTKDSPKHGPWSTEEFASSKKHINLESFSRFGPLLLIVAVGSKPENMDLIMADVNHLRNHYNGRVDVHLQHYDQSKQAWLKYSPQWYKNNVQHDSYKQGFKMPAVSKFISHYDQIKDYDWVWLMDEDIDVTKIEIPKMFSMALETGSPIVGPSLQSPLGKIGNRSKFDGKNLPSMFMDCVHGDIPCLYQSPDARCRYSYTKYIELTTPLFRPPALWQALHQCEDCFTNFTDWGLDFIWCSRAAELYELPQNRGCALLDQSPVTHRDMRTLPIHNKQKQEWQQESMEHVKSIEQTYPEHFVTPNWQWKPECVPDETAKTRP